jgi:hypothetical protein
MIDYVYGGEFLAVTSSKGAQPWVNMSSTQPMIGALAYDHNSQSMKVHDGNSWLTVGGGVANIHLTQNAISILKWAEQKMLEEAERNKLAETTPAIRDLMEQIKEKEEQICMIQTLINEEVKV